jgi:hypothetical protein
MYRAYQRFAWVLAQQHTQFAFDEAPQKWQQKLPGLFGSSP